MPTRRDFLTQVGHAGGFAAAFVTMRTLGLMPDVSASTLTFGAHTGAGVRVVILGGGIAGLVSALELSKAGFTCKVLEARRRPGGRNWTVRRGTTVEFIDGTRQVAEWEPDSYLNAGPARLPSIHKTILGYCRELGVPLEVEVNSSRSALLVNDKAFGGKPIEQRQILNDTRGHVAELLAKCVRQHALDEEMSKEDCARMLDFLKTYGDLTEDHRYTGSARAGVSRLPGAAGVTQELRKPLDLSPLLDAGFWRGGLFEEQLTMQATMFQPVGGMDRIPFAFARRLGPIVQYEAQVSGIHKTPSGVRIVYGQHGRTKIVEAEYAICALPVTILKFTPNDFSPRVRQAIASTEYADGFKIAWESARFWETDFNIYGGLSFLAGGPIGLVWYPSAKLFSGTGVVISGYGTEGRSEFAKLGSMADKLTASRAAIERLHPGFSRQLAKPIYVNWGRIAHNRGSWVGRERETNNSTERTSYYDGSYKEFLEPDDRIYFAGDHCARVGAWQEGAALAAHRVVQMICDRVCAERVA